MKITGLGIYDSESEIESDAETSPQGNGVDSDQELKDRIIKRKQEFSRIEKDIENRIMEQEERERKQLIQDEVLEDEEEQNDVAQVEANLTNSGKFYFCKV
uniref:Uncharacterized protein n=1 Tax=Clastoptera arizonana TaxID=38151 RepID=A0A1B6E3D4_9HEMI